MKASRIWGSLFLVGLIAAGCAVGPTATLVTNPDERLQFPGFSILPPKGENWFMVGPGAYENWAFPITFAKRLREKIERPAEAEMNFARVKTLNFGNVTFRNPAEILRYLAHDIVAQDLESQNRANPGLGIKNFQVKASVEKYLGRDCVTYELSYEVHNWRPFPGFVFIMDGKGLLFLHPDSPTFVIGLEYYQRYLRGEKPYRVEPEVEPFLKSLVFTSLG